MTEVPAYTTFLFDLDGVVYEGSHAIDHAVPTINELVRRGARVGFVTNNASRSPEKVAQHLRELGIAAQPSMIFGSAAAGVALLEALCPPASPALASHVPARSGAGEPTRVLVVGSEYLSELVARAGYLVVRAEDLFAQDAKRSGALAGFDGVAAVIQGFSPTVGWRDLAAASFAIERGARWIATNTDATIPQASGIAPGNGSLVDCVRTATGARPVVAGKPEPAIFHYALASLEADRAPAQAGADVEDAEPGDEPGTAATVGTAATRGGIPGCRSRALMVGDRLDTDIRGGNAAGIDTALVLTGIDTREAAHHAPDADKPSRIIEDLRQLLAWAPQPTSGQHDAR